MTDRTKVTFGLSAAIFTLALSLSNASQAADIGGYIKTYGMFDQVPQVAAANVQSRQHMSLFDLGRLMGAGTLSPQFTGVERNTEIRQAERERGQTPGQAKATLQ